MTPDTPLEIQWFAAALADNEVMSEEDSQQLWESLNRTSDLAEFAEAVIDRLCNSLSLEEQNEVVEQIQQLVDWSCTQAQSGQAPGAGLSYPAADVDLSGCTRLGIPWQLTSASSINCRATMLTRTKESLCTNLKQGKLLKNGISIRGQRLA